MSQEYVFDFFGTKEDFLNVLNKFSNYSTISHGTFFYFNDYIVKVIEFDDTPNSEYHKTVMIHRLHQNHQSEHGRYVEKI